MFILLPPWRDDSKWPCLCEKIFYAAPLPSYDFFAESIIGQLFQALFERMTAFPVVSVAIVLE
jgi:hypothetical protein